MNPGQTGGSQLAPHHVLRLARLEPEPEEQDWRWPGQIVGCSAVFAVPTCIALLGFGMYRKSVAGSKTSAAAADMLGNTSAVEVVSAAGWVDEHALARHDRRHLVVSQMMNTQERHVQRSESETWLVGMAARRLGHAGTAAAAAADVAAADSVDACDQRPARFPTTPWTELRWVAPS